MISSNDGLNYVDVECVVCGAVVCNEDPDTIAITDTEYVCSKTCKKKYDRQITEKVSTLADEIEDLRKAL